MYERSKKHLHLTALILYYLIVYYFLKKGNKNAIKNT